LAAHFAANEVEGPAFSFVILGVAANEVEGPAFPLVIPKQSAILK